MNPHVAETKSRPLYPQRNARGRGPRHQMAKPTAHTHHRGSQPNELKFRGSRVLMTPEDTMTEPRRRETPHCE